jgi:hypothetical protein
MLASILAQNANTALYGRQLRNLIAAYNSMFSTTHRKKRKRTSLRKSARRKAN